jgi:hypothetical protein
MRSWTFREAWLLVLRRSVGAPGTFFSEFMNQGTGDIGRRETLF